MKRIVRPALSMILLAAILMIGLVLYRLGLDKAETWAAIIGLLAVITAVISAFPALAVLELQEAALQPRPTPYFDVSSRYNLLQLRVRNIGPSVAHSVKLTWDSHPRDHEGNEVTVLDDIPVLLPGESVSTMIGVSTKVVKEYTSLRFGGEIEFTNDKGKRMRNRFVCTTQEHGKRLVHDEELPKTLYELQKVPGLLSQIVEAIGETNPGGKSETIRTQA